MTRSEHELRFAGPATAWTEALPVGNGRIGAMLFGGATHERIQINDATAWSGGPEAEFAAERLQPHEARRWLAQARRAVEQRDWTGADRALRRLQHRHSQTFLPFADLDIAVTSSAGIDEPVIDHLRRLDLSTAGHHTSYRLAGAQVTTEAFCSKPDGVLVWRLRSEQPLDLRLELQSELRSTSTDAGPDAIALLLTLPSDVFPTHQPCEDPVRYDLWPSLRGAVAAHIEHDGVLRCSGPTAVLRGVHTVGLRLATATTFRGMGRDPSGSATDALKAALDALVRSRARTLEDLGRRQQEDHRRLYTAASLEFSATAHTPQASTDRRLAAINRTDVANVEDDPGLLALLFHYGRYLLICSSRPGGPPATLQGIWNDKLRPPWSSNYTTNINLQMNYWMTGPANLRDLSEPLFDFVEALAARGHRTARDYYDAPGWVAHHNSDLWGYSLPVGHGTNDPKWAFWPLAAAWLLRHFWDHLEFGGDDEFARRTWPIARSAAEFFLAWLIIGPDGTLGTAPSTSPENVFEDSDGVRGSAARSSAHDLIAINDTFLLVERLAARLGYEDAILPRIAAARQRIPGPVIGRDGLVREWPDEFTYAEPTHRHLSHLIFLHPGTEVVSPALETAARASLDARGDDSTGWSLAWKLAMRARLRQPGKVNDLLRLALRDMANDRGDQSGGLYPNFFAAHPPFQIDGNLGLVAGLCEALLQSHRGEIELLPSLPAGLGQGQVRGLLARPGVQVDIAWRIDAHSCVELVEARLRALAPGAVGAHTVRYGERTVRVDLDRDADAVLLLSAWR